ncbi:unnamed protein product, partial [Thlaspi arvense]
ELSKRVTSHLILEIPFTLEAMKCFHIFKDRIRTRDYFKDDRTRTREQRSEPILKDQSKTDMSAADRVIKSSCSAASSRSIPELYEEKAQNLRVFSFLELRQATNGFNRLLKIGEGGFGSVYKGSIKPTHGKGDPIVVAIKMLNKDGFQDLKRKKNTGTSGPKDGLRCPIWFQSNWDVGSGEIQCSNKALGDSKWETVKSTLEMVIYRDFKTSNVLLDEDFKPKLSDFGLAREGPTDGQTHVSTAVVGTYGYAAPDYIQTGHLTTKSDVWSFGVVLYEILTGRRSLERNYPKTEQKLLEWVKQFPADSKKFPLIMDRRLENQFSLNAARRIARLADSCLVRNAKERPMMSQVVDWLKQIVQVSDEEGPSDNACNEVEDDLVDSEESPKQTGPVESVKRRVAQLTKLSEHIGEVGRSKFMVLQRTKGR